MGKSSTNVSGGKDAKSIDCGCGNCDTSEVEAVVIVDEPGTRIEFEDGSPINDADVADDDAGIDGCGIDGPGNAGSAPITGPGNVGPGNDGPGSGGGGGGGTTEAARLANRL